MKLLYIELTFLLLDMALETEIEKEKKGKGGKS